MVNNELSANQIRMLFDLFIFGPAAVILEPVLTELMKRNLVELTGTTGIPRITQKGRVFVESCVSLSKLT